MISESSRPLARSDGGMTLIELLVCVSVIGLIVTVIASAIVVVFRQQADTQARVDVARWEQSLALWLPADLSSATSVDDDPTAAPCATTICTFGSNALELEWSDGTTTTIVSYRYGPSSSDSGSTFELARVVCTGGSCSSHTVLRDLSPPKDDDGNPIAWSPGDAVPDDVIDVTVPLAVDASTSTGDTDGASRAQRVIINVNGAPGGDGVDRSSTVSFTAGGVVRDDLEPATFTGPQFIDARSDCGGPVTLIVDDSGSIGGNIGSVRSGVRSFVEAFEGTPTQLQIIRFDTRSSTLGTGGWNRFFDLSEPSDVSLLIDGPAALVNDIDDGGGTNWEDALHRAFYTYDGQTYDQLGSPAIPTPELVVFFTDGVPTFDRQYAKSDASSIAPGHIPSRFDYKTSRGDDNDGYGSQLSPRGWYRADSIVDAFRDIRMIGVGVGSAFDDETEVRRSGWPRVGSSWVDIPNSVFLGDLVAGNDPSKYGSGSSGSYVVRQYNSSGGWGDVTAADLLVTNDFSQFGSALTQIALAECGGTLSVQTRSGSGAPADANVTYKIGDEVVTTTRIQKSGTFDVALDDGTPQTIQLVPEPLAGTGYTANGWSCQAGGSSHSYSLVETGDPSKGIELTVSANAAVSCTLQVSP